MRVISGKALYRRVQLCHLNYSIVKHSDNSASLSRPVQAQRFKLPGYWCVSRRWRDRFWFGNTWIFKEIRYESVIASRWLWRRSRNAHRPKSKVTIGRRGSFEAQLAKWASLSSVLPAARQQQNTFQTLMKYMEFTRLRKDRFDHIIPIKNAAISEIIWKPMW